ncbi:MAG: AsmA-like C-terminal domain-containing protein [bacterium]|nr:AsmA-like C-terminal domain-containing protein [bacterium]
MAPVRYAAIVGRRLLRTLIHGLGILAGLIVLVLLGLAWRLQDGPIVLGPATPWVMGMIERSVPDFSFRASDAALSGGDWRTTYGLSLSDVQVLDKEGGIVFESRDIELDMSLPSLIEAELRPVGITIDGARILLVREINGNINYALADSLTDASPETSFLDWFLHAGSKPPLDRLHHVRFDGADITLEDLGSGHSWNAPESLLVIARDDEAMRIDLETVLVSEAGLLPLELAAVHQRGTSRIDVSGELMNLDLASLPGIMPSLGDLSDSMILLDASFQLALDDELELAQGSFVLGTGGGRLAMPGIFGNPIELGPTTLAGRLLPAFGGLEISYLVAGIEEGSLEADLAVNGWTEDSTIEWTLAVADLPVDHLSRYWPVVAAPPARHWIVNNLSNGVIREGTLGMRSTLGDLASGDPPTTDLGITVDVDGVTIDYLHGMPPLAGVDGDVTIAGDAVTIETSGGSIGAITAGRGLVTLDGFDGVLEIRVDLAGPIRDVLAVTAHEPLSHSSHERFDPDTIAGSLSGTLDVTVADLVAPGTDDIGYRFAGSLDGLGLPVAGYQATGGNGTFSFAEPGVIDVNGELQLNGVPVAGAWRLALAGNAEVRERLEITARMDEIQRTTLGLVDPFASTGSVDVTASRTVSGNGTITWSVDADLRHLAFGPHTPVGTKSAGEPGSAHLLASVEDGTFVIRALDVQAGSIVARAAGTVAPHSVHLDVERLAFGRTDVTGTLDISPDGLYSITIDAGSIDMVPLGDNDGTTGILPRLKVAGTVNRLWTTDDRLVRNLVFDADFDDNRFESLNAAGEIEGGSLVALQIWRVSQDERRFDYRAEDMGDTVRVFAGMDNIHGGELAVKGWFDESRTPSVVIGTVTADRFAVHDAPALAHLFAAASLPGLVNILNNQGLVFNAALLPFRQEGERLTVSDGRLYGQGIRILLDGDIHTDQEQVSLAGTMVPTNPLNTVFGKIPLLGDIITGTEDDGGIFAFTFNVDGSADDPDIRVNPLSILAPGILRKLFTESPRGRTDP